MPTCLTLQSIDVADGLNRFKEACLRKTAVEYITELATHDPNKLVLSSNGTRTFMPLADLVKFIHDWIEFHFEADQGHQFIVDVWAWLSRAETKKGGFYIQGPTNSGKSFVLQAVIDLFVVVEIFKPKKGYVFNFDNCCGKQIILADEFWFDPSDTPTVETMKELLCGNTTSIVVKNRGQQCVFPTQL